MDYHQFLPLFFDGLCETAPRYSFIAHQGCLDMIEHAPEKLLAVVPQLIVPIKGALATGDAGVVRRTLTVIIALVTADVPAGGGGEGAIGKQM